MRFKVGFAVELDGRLQKHRCSAPFATYFADAPAVFTEVTDRRLEHAPVERETLAVVGERVSPISSSTAT